MNTWIANSSLIGLAAGVILLPGFLLAVAISVPRRYQLFFAPGLGLGVLGVLTFTLGALKIPWGWPAISVVTVMLAVLAVTTWILRLGRGRKKGAGKSVAPQVLIALVGVVTYAFVQMWVSLPAMSSPSSVPHLGDAAFHLQAIELIGERGNVFPVGGLSDLYSPDQETSVYYPTLFHAWGALMLPFVDVAPAANICVAAVAFVLWPLSIAGLGVSLLPKNVFSGMFATLSVTPIAVFPGAVAIAFSIHPLALSMIGLPVGIAALMRWQVSSRSTVFLTVFSVSVVGAAAAQPSTAVFLVVAGTSVGATKMFTWVSNSMRAGKQVSVVSAVVALVVAALLAVYALRGSTVVQGLISFQRPQVENNPLFAFLNGTVTAVSQPWLPWTLFLFLAAVGTLILWKKPYAWTYLLLVIVASTAFVAAAGPNSTLRALTFPWYKDHLRLGSIAAPLVAVMSSVPISFFVQWLTHKLKPKFQMTTAVGIAVTLAGLWILVNPSIVQIQRSHIEDGYSLNNTKISPLTRDGAEVMSRLDKHFGSNTKVLGDHRNGTAFVVAYSNMKPFIPLMSPETEEQIYVTQHLDLIGVDPEVCEILNRHNVEAFFTDVGREGSEQWGPMGQHPLEDMSQGFELVDREGSVEVWRITACR